MKRVSELDSIQLRDSIVTLGKFDGCHLGHLKLFETAVSLKGNGTGKSVVIFTFNIHPSRLLEDPELRTIQTREERMAYAYPEGVDYVIEFPFNRITMSMQPEEFVQEILIRRLDARAIVCGNDFRFGKGRSGDVETLQKLGLMYGFEVVAVPKVKVRPDPDGPDIEISSTRIKAEIRKGNMELVTAMLGRPYSLTGEVLHGKRLGRTVGFPTINQRAPEGKLLPPDGVYAVTVRIPQEPFGSTERAGSAEQAERRELWFQGITNIGIRPTFDDGDARTVETFLFDFDRDLYGQTVTVEFCHYIRPERKFFGVSQLKEQMEKDRETAEAYFEASIKTPANR